jgi:hypothetical protein
MGFPDMGGRSVIAERLAVGIADAEIAALSLSSTDQGGGKRRDGTSGSGYFQAAQTKLIDRLGTRVSFILGVHGDLGRQIAELIANVPAALLAIRPLGALFGLNRSDHRRHHAGIAICRSFSRRTDLNFPVFF